jgi:Xaa-Pro aminopeptidase
MKFAKLIYAASTECSDVFFASGFQAPDPFIWFETNEQKAVILSALEYGRGLKECQEGVAVYRLEEFFEKGQVSPVWQVICKLAERFDVEQFIVPDDFPLGLAEKVRNAGLVISPADGLFFPERELKNLDQVNKISAAMRVTEDAMQTAIRMIADASRAKNDGTLMLDGQILTSERVRTEINIQLLRHDAYGKDTIVACGPQGADPHCCGYGPLMAGKPIIIDIFPKVNSSGYYGDLTRTVVKGQAPSIVKKAFEAVKAARDAAKAELRAGVIPADVHKNAMKSLSSNGFDTGKNEQGNYGFFHGLGHGLGLDVHEDPRLSPANEEPLKGGEVVTVEPGVYYPEWGGVRLEDVVWIKPDSCKCLTQIDTVLEIA